MLQRDNQAFRREVEDFRRTFEAGSAAALFDLFILCARHRRALPEWAAAPVARLLQQGLLKQGEDEAYRRRQVHYARYDAVCELRERQHELADLYEPTWDDVFAYVSEQFTRSDHFAGGSPQAIKQSYVRVARLMREGHGALFRESAIGVVTKTR